MAIELTPEDEVRFRQTALEWAMRIYTASPPDPQALIAAAQSIYEFLTGASDTATPPPEDEAEAPALSA
jgi:hypothetical protein